MRVDCDFDESELAISLEQAFTQVKKTLESDLSGSWLRHAQRARYAGKTSTESVLQK